MIRRFGFVSLFAMVLVVVLVWTYLTKLGPVASSLPPLNGLTTSNSDHDVSGDVSVGPSVAPSIDEIVSSPEVATAGPALPKQKKSNDIFSRLRALRQCERSFGAKCPGLSEKRRDELTSHPAGLMNALADRTALELVRLKLQAESEMGRAETPSFSVIELAGAYVKHPDDDVREKALDLTELIVFSEPRAALKIASQAVQSTVSGPLAEKALAILQATRTADPVSVDRALLIALDRGGWEVRDRVAEGLLPFLSSDNRDAYARELSKAPKRSKQALYLRLNLEEFDRMQRL